MADADPESRDVKDQYDECSDEEKRKRYRAAFATLPPFTRKVFWAHRIDDLSYAEIAKRYGIGIREVERDIARAIYAIDRCLMPWTSPNRKPEPQHTLDWVAAAFELLFR